MSYLKSNLLLWILLFAHSISAQDWHQYKHRHYLDSLKELRTQLDAKEYNSLLFRGLEKGGDQYSKENLDYLFALIQNYFRQGERDSMNIYLDKAYEIIQSAEPDQLWRWHLGKGNYYYDIPDLATAKSYYLKSAIEIREQGLIDRLPGVLNNLGSTYLNLSQHDTAQIILQDVILIADSLGQVRQSMNARVNIANIFSIKHEYDKAATYYSEAYDVSKKNNISTSHIYNAHNMGRLYSELGQYIEAAKYFDEALIASKEVNQKRTMAAVYVLKADVQLLAGDVDGAEITLEDFANDSLDVTGTVLRLRELLYANIALANNKPRRAKSILNNTFSDLDATDSFPYRADLFLLFAKIQYKLNDLSSALTMAQRGSQNIRSRFAAGIELSELESEILESQNKYRLALAANRQRNVLADSLVTLNKIGIDLMNQVKGELTQSEIARADLVKDYALIERQKQSQLNIIMALIVGLISFAVFGYFYSRNRKLQLEKDLTDVKQQLLRIQINPHFIFNVLNSIQSSFLQEDQEKTIHLFNKFSNLMRQVLENSTNSFIPLNQELELLINYMEIEKSRTNNKFDYKIDIDKDVDIYLEEVPSMVLQIFVENSVWHGVVPKKDRGEIILQISKDQDLLKVAVEDNGVGRSFSLKHKSRDQKENKSMGTDLVLQRLQLLNRKFGRSIEVAIRDGANQIGTRVELAV